MSDPYRSLPIEQPRPICAKCQFVTSMTTGPLHNPICGMSTTYQTDPVSGFSELVDYHLCKNKNANFQCTDFFQKEEETWAPKLQDRRAGGIRWFTRGSDKPSFKAGK